MLEHLGGFKLVWQGGGIQSSRETEENFEDSTEVKESTLNSKGSVSNPGIRQIRQKQDREQGKSRLNCIYFNARGLTGKAYELRALMGTWDWDIIAITETCICA